MALQLVWFKRDLRLEDHRPLIQALALGDVLPLYIVEPDLWRQQDASGRQWAFCREALLDLQQAMAALGQPLVIRRGDAVAVLERARRQLGVSGLWSHEETGNDWTYARDKRVAAWARERSIPWREVPQFGVVRPLRTRGGWARRWEERMAEPITPAPTHFEPLQGVSPGELPSAAELGLEPDPCPHRQHGGRHAGLNELEHFLDQRVEQYCQSISSPNRAFTGSSRLSTYLTWGCLSMREVLSAVVRAGDAGRAVLARDFTGTVISSRSWRINPQSSGRTFTLSCVISEILMPSVWRPGLKAVLECLLWMPACGL